MLKSDCSAHLALAGVDLDAILPNEQQVLDGTFKNHVADGHGGQLGACS